ncbi:MAG: hypothetical protein WA323_15825 [Candidatus Nitrosopolaris sp.]
MQKYVNVTSALEQAFDSFAAFVLQVVLQQAQDYISGATQNPNFLYSDLVNQVEDANQVRQSLSSNGD